MNLKEWLQSQEKNIAIGRELYKKLFASVPGILQPQSSASESLQKNFLTNAFQQHLSATALQSGGAPQNPTSSSSPIPTEQVTASRAIAYADTERETPKTYTDGRWTLRDPRLASAPQAVRSAAQEIKRLLPIIAHLHLKLVETTKKKESPARAKLLKTLRNRLEEHVTQKMEFWAVIDDYAASIS